MALRLITHFDVRADVLPSLRAQAAAAAEGGGAGAGRASRRGRAGRCQASRLWGWGADAVPTGTPGDAPPRRVVPGVVTGKGRREAEGWRALACPQGSPRTRSASKCRLTRCGGQENDLLSVLTVTSLVPSEDAEHSQSQTACKKWNSVALPRLLKKTFAAYLWNRVCIPGTTLVA